jgi:hypothetical protein
MDSGAFIDIIPIILNYLDLKNLIQLSKTCYFWRQQIYTNAKLWSKEIIELPYVGHIGCENSESTDCKCFMQVNKSFNPTCYLRDAIQNAKETHIKDVKIERVKLWSTILSSVDPNALENVLAKIASSEKSIQRFKLVEKVSNKS